MMSASRRAGAVDVGASPCEHGANDAARLLVIAEVCELFGLTQRAVRYYEQVGLIRPRRDPQNRRRYPAEARRRLEIISHLRRAHISLATITRLLEMPRQSERDRALSSALQIEIGRLDERRRAMDAMLASLGDPIATQDVQTDNLDVDCDMHRPPLTS